MKKNGLMFVLLVILLLAVAGLGGYYAYGEYLKNNDGTENTTESTTAYEDFIESAKRQRVDEELKLIKTEENRYRIRITSSGDVYVNSQVVETAVLKVSEIYASQSDICNGNNSLVFIKEDGTITALNIDSLVCGDGGEIKLITDFGELKDIVKIYYEETIPASYYEPALYSVYALDINGNKTDITDYLILV